MKDSDLDNSSIPLANFYVRVVERNGGGTIIGSRKTTIGNFAAGLTSLPKCATIYGGDGSGDDITIKGTSHGSPSGSNVILQPTAGNVGIATTNPAEMLQIGPTNTQGGALLVRLKEWGSVNYTDHARIYTGDYNFGIGAGGYDGTFEHGDLYLFCYSGAGRGISFKTTTNGKTNPSGWSTLMRLDAGTGNVGIGTVTPGAKLQIGTTPADSGSYSLSNWNGTGSAVSSFIKSATNNGGSSPAAAQPALVLGREGISSQAYANFAEFKLRRFENSGVAARTALDIALTHGNGDAAGTDVLTLLSSGNVGIGTTSPSEKLEVAGNIRLSGNVKVGSNDTGLERVSAGVLKVTDGSTGVRALHGGGASVASASTLPLPTGRVFHVTGTTNITNITATNFQAGVVITLIFDGTLTVTDGGNLKLANNFSAAAGRTLTLIYDGSNWFEISRSNN